VKGLIAGLLLAACTRHGLLTAAAETGASPNLDRRIDTTAGSRARYVNVRESGLAEAVVKSFASTWGSLENTSNGVFQWLLLEATKANGIEFRVWLLTRGYPAETREAALLQTARFIVQQGSSRPQEFQDRSTGKPALPSLGGWTHLFPRPAGQNAESGEVEQFPKQTRYLGQIYRLEAVDKSAAVVTGPSDPKIVRLLPDLLVGLASNTRQKDKTRRYDGSEYDYVRLSREDHREMAEAGINCVRVDRDQLPFIEDLDVFYWGLGAAELSFPECFYNSRYLGPALFLDEPAVSTRDHVLRPRLAKEEAFRSALTPQVAFDAFREYFRGAWQEGAATALFQGMAGRQEIDAGEMRFLQENLFSWETMISTAAYQLSQDQRVPAALVFEPPGRVGTRRTLPEIDMTYGCQIPVENPNYFVDILYGFLRGAARLTGKQWGTSIYGAVDRADAFWSLTHAYDLGATRFFFWDNAQLACVPYNECLALARALKMRAENYPDRDLDRLKQAAEVALLLPAGYNLGHVSLGKGDLWGLGELNLERRNPSGVTYRTVMGNFFTEVERCLRAGVGFDVLGEFPGISPKNYREVVRIREDGKVEIKDGHQRSLLDRARVPTRPDGDAPGLAITVSNREGKSPLAVTAQATATETSAPIFYTLGTDTDGIYHNAAVAWELFGPGETDHRFLVPRGMKPHVTRKGQSFEALMEFRLATPGQYRLRAATVDLAGRSTVVWNVITVTGEDRGASPGVSR
jgi:hypothetical protein